MYKAAGLGASLKDQYEGGMNALMGMIHSARSRLAKHRDTPVVVALKKKLENAIRWAQAAADRWSANNIPGAVESVAIGLRIMHEVSAGVNALRPEDVTAAEAQREAERGASVSFQVGETITRVVTEPIAAAVESISPAAANLVRSSGWLVPLAGGLLLFTLIRR